jgi:hypothetical protein
LKSAIEYPKAINCKYEGHKNYIGLATRLTEVDELERMPAVAVDVGLETGA